MFQVFSAEPTRGQKFARMMSFMGETDGFDPEILVNGYPWASVGSGRGTIVDVGGSHGMVMLSVAYRFPSLRYIIQDLPATIEEARRQLPLEASKKLEFMSQCVLYQSIKLYQLTHGK